MNFFDFLSDSINVCPFAKKIVSAEENTQPDVYITPKNPIAPPTPETPTPGGPPQIWC